MHNSRRQFLVHSGVGLIAAGLAPSVGRAGTNRGDALNLALVGCGSQGGGLIKSFAPVAGVRFAYVCDVDPQRRESAKADTGAEYAVDDLRRALDDKSVDAVVVATPDHWHVPAALLAMQAGKHVYVEKPCCQNIREGVLLCEAQRQYGRVVQHGTQFRSHPLGVSAIEALRGGLIGDVLAAKAWNIQRRKDIGHEKPSDPPPGVNYDLWVGPAEFVPFQSNRFHYNWRWWRNFGSGDIGNDGIHEIDLARWGLGVETLPAQVSGTGGKYFFDDDQEFPDTMTVTYEYPGDGAVGHRRMLMYEQRLWSTNYPFNVDSGVEFYGTRGKMFLSKRGKLEVLGERNQRMPFDAKPPEGLLTHYEDFADAVRTGRTPRAPVETAFLTAALAHLGNIAVRLGRSLRVDASRPEIVGDAEANQLLGRSYRENHWATPRSKA